MLSDGYSDFDKFVDSEAMNDDLDYLKDLGQGLIDKNGVISVSPLTKKDLASLSTEDLTRVESALEAHPSAQFPVMTLQEQEDLQNPPIGSRFMAGGESWVVIRYDEFDNTRAMSECPVLSTKYDLSDAKGMTEWARSRGLFKSGDRDIDTPSL